MEEAFHLQWNWPPHRQQQCAPKPVEMAFSSQVVEASSPMVVSAFPLPFEGINSEMVMVSPEAIAMKDNVDSTKNHPYHPSLLLGL